MSEFKPYSPTGPQMFDGSITRTLKRSGYSIIRDLAVIYVGTKYLQHSSHKTHERKLMEKKIQEQTETFAKQEEFEFVFYRPAMDTLMKGIGMLLDSDVELSKEDTELFMAMYRQMEWMVDPEHLKVL